MPERRAVQQVRVNGVCFHVLPDIQMRFDKAGVLNNLQKNNRSLTHKVLDALHHNVKGVHFRGELFQERDDRFQRVRIS